MLFVLILLLAQCKQRKGKLEYTDCGDDSYLLHFHHVYVSDLIRGRDVEIRSNEELLIANITSGNVELECLRNHV